MMTLRKKILFNGITPTAFNSTTRAFDDLDVTDCKSIAIQVEVAGVNAAGSVKLQWSVNGTTWEDVPSALGGVTATWTTAATKIIYANGLSCNRIRAFATSTDTNPWTVTGTMIAKEY